MSEIRVNSVIAEGGSSAPNLTYGAQVPTGMGITGAGGVNVTGVVTATSFSGSGANLTGIANTAYIDSASLTVSGIATFNGVGNFDAEVTAAGGVDITGGLKVGAASTLAAVSSSGVVNLTNTTDSTSSTTGALIISGGVGIAKSLFVGNNVTIGGTLTYEDVTNIDSVGLITAQAGLNVSGGPITVGSGITVAQAGIVTFADGTASTNGVHFGSAGRLKIYSTSNSMISHDMTDSDLVINSERELALKHGGEQMVRCTNDSTVKLYHDGSERLSTTAAGVEVTGTTDTDQLVVSGMSTCTTGAVIGAGITANNTNIHFNKTLVEKTSIAGGTLGSNNNHSLADGMVYYCTGNESGNLTYNIRQDGSTALSAVMGVGETITTTVILSPNNSGKINTMQIDGNAQTVEEAGGDAFSAGTDGYDVYTFTILRTGTGNTDYLVLGVLTNHT